MKWICKFKFLYKIYIYVKCNLDSKNFLQFFFVVFRYLKPLRFVFSFFFFFNLLKVQINFPNLLNEFFNSYVKFFFCF